MKIMLLAAIAATTPLAPATAETVRTSRTVAVHDLTLSLPGHRARLDRRLALAARAVCGEASTLDVTGQRQVRHCRKSVLRQAAPARDRLVAQAVAATTLAGR